MGSSFPKPKLPFFAPKDIKVSFKQENSQSKKRILKHIIVLARGFYLATSEFTISL